MFIQYINKLPSKMEFYDMLNACGTAKFNISDLDKELFETITAVCVYNGDKIIGIGRVKKENRYLYIQDIIVALEEYKEEIEKNIIVNLIEQINQLKQVNVEVRDCLQMTEPKTNFYERYNFLISDSEIIAI